MKTLLSRRQDIHIKRAAMIEAIRFGDTSIMDDLLKSEEVGSGSILVGSPKLATAIEECCTHGHIAVIRRMLDTNFRYRSTVILWLGNSLHAALSNRNLEMVNLLVEAGADVNAMTRNYQTALLVAIHRSNKPLIGKLLKAGATLNAKGNCCLYRRSHEEFSGAALVSAITYGPCADYAVVKSLIEAGADINAPGSTRLVDDQKKCWCITPLTAAARCMDWQCIKALIYLGAAVNNPPGIQLSCTPLAAATRRKSIPLVQFLLGEGANPEDAQALEAATEDAELLEFLLRLKSRRQLQNNSNLGRLAIDKAIRRQDKATVKAILDSKLVDLTSVQDGSSVLYQALRYDRSADLDIVRMILSSGADPSGIVLEDDGDYSVQSALLVTIHDGSQPKLKRLLEAGAAPDIMVDGMEFSPLQLAVHKQDQAMVHILLDHGANPDATSLYGERHSSSAGDQSQKSGNG
jgi:ankyrin repeat protein